MGYAGDPSRRTAARRLRAEGWTLSEICSEVGCSKASASLWCRDVAADPAALDRRRRDRYLAGNQGARQRGPNKLQRARQAEIDGFVAAGRRRLAHPTDRELLVAGVALYAGEGSKRDGAVGFANSDPRMIQLFIGWLRRFFAIDEGRLRVALYLHEGLDLAAAQAHWSAVTGVPVTQFRKPYRARADPSIRTSKHPMGCATVIYQSASVHREILGLMQALLSSSFASEPACTPDARPIPG
jgi:hypothetical protein